jgi:hypothetical protein
MRWLKVLILATIFFFAFNPEESFSGEQLICGKDIDGDGALNASEAKACSGSVGNSLCPIDAVDCVVPYSPVTCPNGTAWNSQAKQCESVPVSDGIAWTAVKTASGLTIRNDCIFGQDSLLPSGTSVVSAVPTGAVSLGDRYVVTHCQKKRGRDRATYDVYAYYSLKKVACPVATSMNSGQSLCIGTPSCPSGTYDAAAGQCSAGIQCPLNTATTQFTCVKTGQKSQCSPIQCEDVNRSPEVESDLTSFRDDGQINDGGTCNGQMMVFNGNPAECRVEGLQTGYFNCCRNDSASILKFAKYCKDEEKTLNANRDGGACHRVGTYCKKNSIFGCLQKAETYCCFGSKLARIVHEQGRNQLKEYSANNLWGSPSQPFCNGMSSEQLSMLDFNQMDLSEYAGSLVTDKDLFGSVEKKINEFYQNSSR